ncbi:MAG TPA: 4a-hydroxytetrahydrobiopterin dehydratase [Legionella sp.]|nr:4a-hydroxytetrahydrobiopterin dehydratase [Legionella sp.]
MTSDLSSKHCKSCEGIGEALNAEQVLNLRSQLHENWKISSDSLSIKREFSFKNYYETIAFINAVAWIAHTENHHPDLDVKYKDCHVIFSTHALNGLSLNDFICAAKVDKLFND